MIAGYQMNEQGVLQYVEGWDRSGEGFDVSQQEHVKRLFSTKRPVVSGSFMAVEEYYAIAIHAPIVVGDKVKGSTATIIKWDAFGPWF